MVARNQEFNAQNQDLPIASMFFGAVAGLTNAAAQNVPPGTGAQTSLTSTTGIIVSRPGVTLTRISAVTDAVITGLATTAGSKVGTVDFVATPQNPSDADIYRVTSTPSAALTAAVSDISVSLS